jgi:hypothetical protein
MNAEISWFCENGCQWTCYATQIQVSVRFLRLTFKCPTCLAGATRYYDLEERGFVDVTGRIASRARNKLSSKNYPDYLGVRQQR